MGSEKQLNISGVSRNAIGIYTFFLVFSFCYMLTCPFGFNLLLEPANFLQSFFQMLASVWGKHVFHLSGNTNYRLVSDSSGAYIHLLNLSIISGVLTMILIKRQYISVYAINCFEIIIRYYLALMLFIYGFNKVFKYQFYFPEPNVLYTPLGQLSKDILFWSAIGSSYSYSVFAGLMEIIPAILLLFKRTYLLGAIIAFAVMLNVSAINFSFDISVKIFSLFLLLLCMILIAPHFKRLYFLFIYNRDITSNSNGYFNFWRIKGLFKIIAIGAILFESLYPYYSSEILNGDKRIKPNYFGAYKIVEMKSQEDSSSVKPYEWNHLFFHSRYYLIVEDRDHHFSDYSYEQLKSGNIAIGGELIQMQEHKNELILNGKIGNKKVVIRMKKINESYLPLYRDGFHWTSDSP